MTTAAAQVSARGPRPYVVTVSDCTTGVAVRVTGLTGWRRVWNSRVLTVPNVHQAAAAAEALRAAGYAATYRTDEPLDGAPLTRWSWVVTTDAAPTVAERAAPAPGRGWRRRDGQTRRAFASETEAAATVSALTDAGHAATLRAPETGHAPTAAGMRIDEAVWQAARARLEALDAPTAVTVTLAPGTSRNAAVSAFLRALVDGATQVSAEESK